MIPVGQTHSPSNKDYYFCLKFALLCEFLQNEDGRTNVRTDNKYVKIVITTGRDCGLASWIN